MEFNAEYLNLQEYEESIYSSSEESIVNSESDREMHDGGGLEDMLWPEEMLLNAENYGAKSRRKKAQGEVHGNGAGVCEGVADYCGEVRAERDVEIQRRGVVLDVDILQAWLGTQVARECNLALGREPMYNLRKGAKHTMEAASASTANPPMRHALSS